jgi:hypothetical protein
MFCPKLDTVLNYQVSFSSEVQYLRINVSRDDFVETEVDKISLRGTGLIATFG